MHRATSYRHFGSRLIRTAALVFAIDCCLLINFGPTPVWAEAEATPDAAWWSQAAEQALARADTNRMELAKALGEVPTAQREGMQFLVENMP